MKTSIFRVVFALSGLALGAVACSSDKKPAPALTALSGGCLVNSDCADPLVCVFERCHVECVTTRDCDGTLRCVGAHEASRVCQLDVESACKASADCAKGLVCGSDGACRDHCASDAECGGGQVCSKGVCAEPRELDASGSLPQVLALHTCRLSSDCDAGKRCAAGNCVAECLSERDCAPGDVCTDGACTPATAQCQSDEQCSPAGASCVAGKCRCECHANVDCAEGATCDGCACHAGPGPECAGNADCAASKQCVDGACLCRCVTDRDCGAGQSCDGCGCVTPPPPTSIENATLNDAQDLSAMRGITDVQGKLLLYGNTLSSTLGLESVQSVGTLELNNLYGLSVTADTPNPLVGLSSLTTVRGDLIITNLPLSALELNPALQVGGNISIQYSSLTCATLKTLQQAFVDHGFKGTFSTLSNGGCSGACSQGMCFPLP